MISKSVPGHNLATAIIRPTTCPVLVGAWKFTREYSRRPTNDGVDLDYGTIEYSVVFEKDLRVRFTSNHPDCILEGTYKLLELHKSRRKGIVECDFALPKKLELKSLWSPIGRHRDTESKVDEKVAAVGFQAYPSMARLSEHKIVKHDLPFVGHHLVGSYKSIAKEYHLPLLDNAKFSFVANEEGYSLVLESSKEIVYKKQRSKSNATRMVVKRRTEEAIFANLRGSDDSAATHFSRSPERPLPSQYSKSIWPQLDQQKY
jgi:hypothetical protein